MRRRAHLAVLLLALPAAALLGCGAGTDARLAGSWRSASNNGWIRVRLQGSPSHIGFQHGYLLAPEIADALAVARLSLPHDTKRDWAFLRGVAADILWPHVAEEYRQELQGMATGLAARGFAADVTDLVVLNAFLELSYYTDTLDAKKPSSAPERCSAFVATGSWTRDGRVVIGHNNWSGYLEGARWNVIFDLRPEHGHRILMDGMPGLIHSGDDFGINAAGIVITETTISGFRGFDTQGIPEFVRARAAMQYAGSIDDFAGIMERGNNGGYANAWLVADVGRNEIARLELGLRHVTLERTGDGIFVGANFPIDAKLIAEETDFKAEERGASANARRTRWQQLIPGYRGRIDVAVGKRFLADHFDAFANATDAPSERTLCGHVELSPRGMKPWKDEFGPAGVVQAKITDAEMAARMELEAAIGHPCGLDFRARAHLAKHTAYAWQQALLRDLPAGPWTRFSAP